MPRERLQKVLAAAGIASRRECEQIILDGRVRVNGKEVLSLPVLVDPARDSIVVDGKPLKRERKIYLLFHKPKGVHCTNYDPDGRPRVVDLLVGIKERLFPVGRLDADSTGLLLMTNDGELAEHLTHPRYGVPKTYRAHVNRDVTDEDMARLKKGVWLAEGKTHVADAKVIHRGRQRSVLEITLQEGRNREVRRILAKLGHNVRRLMRIGIGPLSLRGLPPGAFRPLTPAELQSLRRFREPSRRPPEKPEVSHFSRREVRSSRGSEERFAPRGPKRTRRAKHGRPPTPGR